MSITASCLLAFFSLSASAQQYAGDTISGTLPGQDGSEVAYFRISDPSGANDQLTLVNYYSHASNGQRIQESAVERAVIMMSGMNRNAGDYQGYVSIPALVIAKSRLLTILIAGARRIEQSLLWPEY